MISSASNRLGMALMCLVSVWGCSSELSSGTNPIPTTPEALHSWLLDGGHLQWTAESSVHKSTLGDGGPRVFLNDALVDSLSAGNAVHPVGAAAVREMYEPDMVTPHGFGVLIKIDETGQGAADWYFYETFQMESGAPFSISQTGAPGCVGCHQDGVDFVQSNLPLP